MSSNPVASADGRRVRRERSRAAVIEAVFELVLSGNGPPTVEQIAERSGVSASSIFRMFDGLDDMRAHAFEQFEHRYAHLLAANFAPDEGRSLRIDRLVRMRVDLYVGAGPLLTMVRHRAFDHESIADRVRMNRRRLADQVWSCFAAETTQLTRAESANLVALVDATPSPEAFEVLGAAHARTRRQIERTWRRAVTGLTDAWCSEGSGPPVTDATATADSRKQATT